MDVREKNLLSETAKLARENNALLRKLHRAAIWSRVFRVLYWAIVIGIAVGAFFFLQPYIDAFRQTFVDLAEGLETARTFLQNIGGE